MYMTAKLKNGFTKPGSDGFDRYDHYFVTLYTRGRNPLFTDLPAMRRLVQRCWRETMDQFPALHPGEFLLRPWSLHAFIRMPPQKSDLLSLIAAEDSPAYGKPKHDIVPIAMVEDSVAFFRNLSDAQWQKYATQRKLEPGDGIWQNERHIHRLYDLAEYKSFMDFVAREKKRGK